MPSRLIAALLAVATISAISSTSVSAQSSSCAPWMNAHLTPAARAHALLGAMTLSDKVNLVTGDTAVPEADYPNYGAAGVVFGQPDLCIPPLVLNDAAAGIGDMQVLTTAFPDGVTQASTWDMPLLRQYGDVLGREAFAKGVNVLLGPGIDILRDPLNGRGWEYYGEDPYLTGQAGAALVRGIQENPVVAEVKHYAADDEEGTSDNNGGVISNDVSKRTMEEIELPAFQDAVDAGAGAVMCTSAKLNNVYGCQNRYYLTGVLRGQFHFTGFVTSDWQAAQSTVGSADGGMDIEMPSAQYYGPALQTAVQQGKVSEATLNGMVYDILFTMFRLGLFDHAPQEGSQAFAVNASTSQSIAMATQIAEEGTVLLKNQDGILPLGAQDKRIAIIGEPASPAGATLTEQGYGSGHVPEPGYPTNTVSPLQAITARAAQAGDVVSYDDGTDAGTAALAAKAANVAIVFVSDVSSEGFDRPDLTPRAGYCDPVNQTGCTYFSTDQDALVSAVAAANPNTIVVLQNGGPLTMPWLPQVKGVIEGWYPGQVDGDAVAPVLFGDFDPSGHLPETFPRALSDGPLRTALQYPGVNGQVVHSEGLLVGYRWYSAKHIAPMFPFGFGLSYTSFRFSHLSVARRGPGELVRFRLSDTGARAGADVAQVYVGDPASTGEPPEQLAAFARVPLAASQSTNVSLNVSRRSMSYWQVSRNRWTLASGCYSIYVGDSSANLPLATAIVRGAHRGRCTVSRRNAQ
jgi:beta-glucosidase